jgi:predicted nucleic acid-binding protein
MTSAVAPRVAPGVAPRVAYVDTSCLVAIAFGEHGSTALERRLNTFEELIASALLEGELRAAFARERAEVEPELLTAISWVLPDRPLSAEIRRVLAAGYLRGADCWHVAAALYVADDPADITFLTLDGKQHEIARALGFGE